MQRGERAADQAGLPRHLNHGVPNLLGQRGVRSWLASIHGNQDRAGGDRPAAAAGEAGHVMPTSHALASHSVDEDCRWSGTATLVGFFVRGR